MANPTNNVAIQNAWLVSDIENVARQWSSALNIGPFYLAEYTSDMFETLEYRGTPGKLQMKTAIAYAGNVQIELVEPVGVYPCAYYDTIPEGTTGFHHLCYWSDDIDADLAHYQKQGFEIANFGKMAGGPRFAYVDASATLGCMIELLERATGIEKLFNSWKEKAEDWKAGNSSIIKL